MSRMNRSPVLLLAAALILFTAASADPSDEGILYWTCGMHPSVRGEEPGKCPICNMDLVPVMAESETASSEEKKIELTIDPDAARLARIRTVEVARMALVKTIRAPGELAYDETRSAVISSRVSGWIEHLHADYTGIEIEEGEPLADIYSPELVTAQKEYLLARGTALERSAREKLLLLGVAASQIDELDRRSETKTLVPVLAETGGTVVHRFVTDGDHVTRGQALFHVSDLSRLWVLADLFENDLRHVEIGQAASVTSDAFPGEEILAQVAFIEPSLDRKTRSAKVRLEVCNRDRRLRPGIQVDVTFRIPLSSGEGGAGPHADHAGDGSGTSHGGVLAVPRSAIIDTGARTVAFVEIGPGRYELRNVELGASAGDYYAVLAGLEEGERVVERGSFLLDSQTQLTGWAEEIYGGALGKESDKAESQHQQHKH
jgi:Cu(I)/Ag(I) efflux system membrane fusion protein